METKNEEDINGGNKNGDAEMKEKVESEVPTPPTSPIIGTRKRLRKEKDKEKENNGKGYTLGFSLASGKKVKFSEESLRKAKELFSDDAEIDLPPEFYETPANEMSVLNETSNINETLDINNESLNINETSNINDTLNINEASTSNANEISSINETPQKVAVSDDNGIDREIMETTMAFLADDDDPDDVSFYNSEGVAKAFGSGDGKVNMDKVVRSNYGLMKKESTIGQLKMGQQSPKWKAKALVNGEFKEISLDDYKGKYVVFFFYPLDFTYVSRTEVTAFSDRVNDFRKIGCEVIAASTDSHFSHFAWVKTQRKDGGLGPIKIPLIADITGEIAKSYGVFKEDQGIPYRGLFIIDKKQTLRQITINDIAVAHSVAETLRLVQAFQFTDDHGEVCPAGWKPGDKTIKPDKKGSLEFFTTE